MYKQNALQWYEQYLKPGKCKVVINNQYSTIKTMDCSIPQGSVQGVYLFIAYASTVQDIINNNLTLNGFTDDHSIWKPFRTNHITTKGTTDENFTITIIKKSMLNIKVWMYAVRLKLNELKTEFIYFGCRQQLTKCQEKKTIKVVQEDIQLCSVVCYLGGYLDSTPSITDHIRTKYKAAIINIIQIRNIRKYQEIQCTPSSNH